MSIVEFDGPPYRSLDARETGESTEFPWVVAVRSIGCGRRRKKIDCNSFTLFRVHRAWPNFSASVNQIN